MTKNGLLFIFLFIVFLFLQVAVLNQITLLGYAVPLLYVYFILKLPTSVSENWMITLGFLLGLSVDIFSNTLGLNAFATTLTAALRNPLLSRIQHRDEQQADIIPGVRSMGAGSFFRYAGLLILLQCILLFGVESVNAFHFWYLLLKIGSSALLSFLMVVCIEGLRREKS